MSFGSDEVLRPAEGRTDDPVMQDPEGNLHLMPKQELRLLAVQSACIAVSGSRMMVDKSELFDIARDLENYILRGERPD